MITKTYQIKIEAHDENEAIETIKALVALYKSASNQELIKLAKAVEKKPGLVKKALMFI